ncbi:MAG TPA: hypothetical protein VKX33_11675 [Cyclobacteriaceae bacterium]|nr:hypothetical protein [Cyclobacteriaceae bacterium]
MHPIKINALLSALNAGEMPYEEDFHLPVNEKLLDKKARELLKEAYQSLGGSGEAVHLHQLKFDFKIDRFLFLYDGESHFNRYRLTTFKTDIYETFTFSWMDAYKRLCRTYEKDCLKVGMQERVWIGPPLALRCFGEPEEAGYLSGNGAPGWKLNAYNDAQYDLISRLSGYKIIRLPMYENIMSSGSLQRLDQLLAKSKEDIAPTICGWLKRKMV